MENMPFLIGFHFKKKWYLKLTASLHLKMDGWNTIVSFEGPAYFQVRWLLVIGSVQ